MNRISIKINKDYIERDELWLATARKLYQLKMIINEHKKEELKVLESLKLLSSNMNSKAGEFIFTKTMRKGSISYSDIQELKNIDLELYRKEAVETWKLQPVLMYDSKE